jgi:hypothetical protein
VGISRLLKGTPRAVPDSMCNAETGLSVCSRVKSDL